MKNKTIEISLEEYQRLQEEIKLLKDNDLLQKMNQLVDMLYRDKNNLYMGDCTEDLAEASLNNSRDKHSKSAWDVESIVVKSWGEQSLTHSFQQAEQDIKEGKVYTVEQARKMLQKKQ